MVETIRLYSEIEYVVADRIATITLSRPDQLNAFTQVMRDELIEAFDRVPLAGKRIHVQGRAHVGRRTGAAGYRG